MHSHTPIDEPVRCPHHFIEFKLLSLKRQLVERDQEVTGLKERIERMQEEMEDMKQQNHKLLVTIAAHGITPNVSDHSDLTKDVTVN